jgi:hypothetical protein
MKILEEDCRSHTSHTDQLVMLLWILAIKFPIGVINGKLRIAGLSSIGEETARKEFILGIQPINCFNLLLDWYLQIQC